ARLTRFARDRGIPVLATACAHAPDDPEMSQLGPHCLVGTLGQSRVEATAWPGSRVLGPSETFSGAGPSHLTVEDRAFDVFSRLAAERLVGLYDRDRPTLVVYGVARDYCVKAAVLGLLGCGCKVAVVVDAIRAIDRDGEAEALAEFTRRGALLTLTGV